jgi:hypothetical protein
MRRNRYLDALRGEDVLLYGRYPALRALYPVHDRAPARGPAPNDRRPHRTGRGRL